MRFEDYYHSNVVAEFIQNDMRKKEARLGENFFPDERTVGLSIEWLKQTTGVDMLLNVSTLDSVPKIRGREGFQTENTEMAFFRESMHIKERDMLMLAVAESDNNPYVRLAFANAFNDVAKLVGAADVATELMRMQLLATDDGTPKISLGTVDNTIYQYNYDPDGKWKAKHYTEIKGTSKWSAPATATPLDDLNDAKRSLRKLGFTPTYALMNANTFKYLLQSEQVKNAIITASGTSLAFVNEENVKSIVKQTTGLTIMLYDDTYKDYTGAEKNFYPDDRVTILGNTLLGKTWRGTTPEERTLIGNNAADITVLDNGIAIAVKTEAGPPVKIVTSVSQMAIPSYEGMDSVHVLNVKGD